MLLQCHTQKGIINTVTKNFSAKKKIIVSTHAVTHTVITYWNSKRHNWFPFLAFLNIIILFHEVPVSDARQTSNSRQFPSSYNRSTLSEYCSWVVRKPGLYTKLWHMVECRSKREVMRSPVFINCPTLG